jgi:hypothetical protein
MATKDPGLISFTARTSRGSFEEYDRGASALSSGIEVALRGLNPATLDRRFKPAPELWRA